MICLWDESVFKGAGTHAEVTLAYDCKKPVYLINKIGVSDLSGWIMACSSEIFPDFDELKSFAAEMIKTNMAQFGQLNSSEKEVDDIVARVLSNTDEVKRMSEQLTSQKLLTFYKENVKLKVKKLNYDAFVKEVYGK